jgi:hypothetical protein
MHRTDASGNVANLFVDKVPGVSAGTIVDDDWLNAVQEENANAIEADGTTLVKGTNTQLRTVLSVILAGTTPGGRLTLSSLLPVTITDVTAATTVRYALHNHNRIALYNGTRWVLKTFTELSQATTDTTKSPAAVANNSMYDVFVWDDAGTLRATRGPPWTSDIVRGAGAGTTELARLDGRFVNNVAITNGPAAQRGLYVGTFRSDASAQVNDTLTKRHVWNMYNRVPRPMKAVDATVSWNYSTNTFRQANGSTANQLDFILGLNEERATASALGRAYNSGATYRACVTAIGLDSTTTPSGIYAGFATSTVISGSGTAFYEGFPGLGRHFLAWLERGDGIDTQSWSGTNVNDLCGITGEIMA